jgi:hypothetical protein
VCEPVRYTARPVGSAKYRGFVGWTVKGPGAGLGSARRGDAPKTIVRHSIAIVVRPVLVLDCTMCLHSFWTSQSTRDHAFDLNGAGIDGRLRSNRSVCGILSSHECVAYTFAEHDPRFIRSMDHLRCHMAICYAAD